MKRLPKVGLLIVLILAAVCAIAIWIGSRRNAGTSSGLSLNIGKTETHNNTFSASSSSASENATFNSGRVLLVQTETDGFGQRLADLVASGLTNCPQVEAVQILKPGAAMPDGFEAPDIFVRLHVVSLDRSGLLSSKLKVRVEGALGTAPWQSSHHSRSRTSPPSVGFFWNATIENETTFSGVRSDRYAETLHSIAEAFVNGASNELATLSAKYPPLPQLPRIFHGPYQPVNDFDFLKNVNARRVCSYCGLFTHNETFWEFETATDPEPLLQRIIDQLAAAGWQPGDVSLTNAMSPYAQLRKNYTLLEIFRENRPDLSEDRPDGPLRFVVRYTQPFSPAEVESAVETLFAGQVSVESLLPFQDNLSPGQRDRFYALLENTPTTRPVTCLQLAEHYLGRQQTNAAVNMLVRAKALRVAANDDATVAPKIDSIAKKISPKNTLKLEVTPDVCRDLEFLEITNTPQHLEVERELGRPVLWFSQGDRGIVTSALIVHPPRHGICDWKFVQAEEGVRSEQWSSFDPRRQNSWRQNFDINHHTISVTGQLLPGAERMAFTIEAER